MKTEEKRYFARRCDITGQGINTGYLWRHLGRITATGQPSEAMAVKSGFETLEEAIKAGHVVFKAWTDSQDVLYVQNADGALLDLVGRPVAGVLTPDHADTFADLVCHTLDGDTLRALSQCLAFGAAVMRERVKLANNEQREGWAKESALASLVSGRLAERLTMSNDWQ